MLPTNNRRRVGGAPAPLYYSDEEAIKIVSDLDGGEKPENPVKLIATLHKNGLSDRTHDEIKAIVQKVLDLTGA